MKILLFVLAIIFYSGFAIAQDEAIKVYDENWQLKYRIQDGRILDKDWKVKGYIRDDKIYDQDWKTKGRIQEPVKGRKGK